MAVATFGEERQIGRIMFLGIVATGVAAIVATATGVPLAIKAAGVKAALAGDPLRAGVQALVNEIRRDLSGEVMAAVHWALQQAADRLEVLPGIEAVACEFWTAEHQDDARRYGLAQVLRGLPS